MQQAASSARSLIMFQLASRLLTFILNAAVVRMMSPELLGVVGVRMELLVSTVLCLSRDGLRMAMLRYPRPGEKDSSSSWDDSFFKTCRCGFAPALGLLTVLTGVFACWPLKVGLSATELAAVYALYGAGMLFEVLSEPHVMRLIYLLRTEERLLIEFASLVARALAILAVVKSGLFGPLAGVLGFACGQLFKGVVIHVLAKIVAAAPRKGRGSVDAGTVGHAWEMTRQLGLKYVLAQGDMLVISLFCRLADQGIYSVVVNYGSLACRLLLQPLEESGLQYYAKAMSSRSRETKLAAFRHLSMVLRLYVILSLLFVLVAPLYTPLLVRSLLGARWADSSMPKVLAAYCLQIPAMAFCGILEAFMNATMTSDWYGCTRRHSVLFSAVYMGSAVVLVKRYDVTGLIAAGCLSFTMRALQGAYYLKAYLRGDRLQRVLPSRATVATILAVALASAWSAGQAPHIQGITGAVSAAAVARAVGFSEGDAIRTFMGR